jgi:hypothetical protein
VRVPCSLDSASVLIRSLSQSCRAPPPHSQVHATHTCTHTHKCTHKCTHAHMHTHTYTHTHIHTHAQTWSHVITPSFLPPYPFLPHPPSSSLLSPPSPSLLLPTLSSLTLLPPPYPLLPPSAPPTAIRTGRQVERAELAILVCRLQQGIPALEWGM